MDPGTSKNRISRLGFPRGFTPIARKKDATLSEASHLRLPIGKPLVPIIQNGDAFHAEPVMATEQTAISGGPPPGHLTFPENIRPAGHTQQNRRPKSRTLHALTSLTQSWSRSSLGSRLTDRDVSNSSTSTVRPEPPTGQERRAIPTRPSSNTASADRTKPRAPSSTGNPQLISSAQPSAYWAGRFTALNDRFHNELLHPNNLNTIITAYTRESSRDNEPQAVIKKKPPASQISPAKQPSRIRSSRTTGAICQAPAPAPKTD